MSRRKRKVARRKKKEKVRVSFDFLDLLFFILLALLILKILGLIDPIGMEQIVYAVATGGPFVIIWYKVKVPITKLEVRLDERTGFLLKKISALENEIKELRKELNSISQRIARLETDMSNIKDRLANIERKLYS